MLEVPKKLTVHELHVFCSETDRLVESNLTPPHPDFDRSRRDAYLDVAEESLGRCDWGIPIIIEIDP